MRCVRRPHRWWIWILNFEPSFVSVPFSTPRFATSSIHLRHQFTFFSRFNSSTQHGSHIVCARLLQPHLAGHLRHEGSNPWFPNGTPLYSSIMIFHIPNKSDQYISKSFYFWRVVVFIWCPAYRVLSINIKILVYSIVFIIFIYIFFFKFAAVS